MMSADTAASRSGTPSRGVVPVDDHGSTRGQHDVLRVQVQVHDALRSVACDAWYGVQLRMQVGQHAGGVMDIKLRRRECREHRRPSQALHHQVAAGCSEDSNDGITMFADMRHHSCFGRDIFACSVAPQHASIVQRVHVRLAARRER